MNVPNQLPEIEILFTNNGLVTILKQMTMSRMTVIEGNRVPGEKSTHEFGKAVSAAAKEDMCVI